ncbi:hypothetical protein [Nocardia sp. NPDC020380]|uniref:hypothetical protein n=1 Tax=Nocardia sp. NPDC020380 TaxID=3364309 RepID=UPI0037A8D7C7
MTRTKEQRPAPIRIDDIERMFGARRSRSAAVEPPLEIRCASGTKRTDADWTVPKQVVAECLTGKLVIDFTQAYCSRREIDVRVHADAGAIVLVVPRGWRVDIEGVEHGTGTVTNKVRLPRFPGAPVIRVVGRVETGTVKARYAYRSPLNWFRRSR